MDAPEPFSDHDAVCKLAQFRCNELDCNWCDYCDATLVSQISQPTFYGSSPKSWAKVERPRPPAREALDLSSLHSGSSDT